MAGALARLGVPALALAVEVAGVAALAVWLGAEVLLLALHRV